MKPVFQQNEECSHFLGEGMPTDMRTDEKLDMVRVSPRSGRSE